MFLRKLAYKNNKKPLLQVMVSIIFTMEKYHMEYYLSPMQSVCKDDKRLML